MQRPDWAHALLDALIALDAVVVAETRAAAAGRIRDALDLLPAKMDAFARYRTALAGWQAHSEAVITLPGPLIAEIRARHEALARTLRQNHSVLTTTRSVAEDLIRDVSHQMSRPLPSAYGPAGQSRAAPSHAPIALSRTS
mgnify:CR=1 FL=1